jgi:ribonuclease BN (tRNA processing enzyme)
MKFQLLPSTFDETGRPSVLQHLATFIVDDCVSIDAGSLGMAAAAEQKKQIRDVVLTHAHLDHIAGLPMFVDDMFAVLSEPIRVHAVPEVIEILERDIFNWDVYPRFSNLKNNVGAVLEYKSFNFGDEFQIKHLNFKSVSVNHKVPSAGFVVSDSKKTFAISGDTAEMTEFWEVVNKEEKLDAVLIECAFPDELKNIAHDSHHLTPKSLKSELAKLQNKTCPVYIINIKPMYRKEIVIQLNELEIENLQILEVGKTYNW